MRVSFAKTLFMILLSVAAAQAHALSSDRNKPATIEADEVEFDFRTGKRTYKGNVVVVQGTLRITGEKMVVEYDQQNNRIKKATSWGDPATFKQRPDGKQHDVYGEGDTIVLDQIDSTLTLIDDASMTQAGNTANGRRIVYDMASDKMTVKGFQQPGQDGGEEVSTDSDTGRAKVIIRPESDSGGEAAEESGEARSEGIEETGSDESGAGQSTE